MTSEPRFRDDLYAGTAADYDRFRPAYPDELIQGLVAACHRSPTVLGDRGRLLDLACGTGQLAFPLAPHFAQVTAVDQEPAAIALGRRKSVSFGVDNIDWRTEKAERLQLDKSFDLVTIGNAFHRLERQLVADRVTTWLRPGGCVALAWGDLPWVGADPWQLQMTETLDRWRHRLGAHDRLPPRWDEAVKSDPHREVLRRAGLDYERKAVFSVGRSWTIESLLGLVYSTSFLNRSVLGGHLDEFEQDLTERLAQLTTENLVSAEITFAYDLARKPLRS